MIVTGDFETYYDNDYSLRKMSEVAYILDPRFQTILCSIQVGDAPIETFIGHDEVARKLATIDWSRAAWLSHNTRFDGAILAWHYRHTPALWLDTLSMARATTHAVLGRSSLEKVSEYLGLPPKGNAVVRMAGVTLEELLTRPNEMADYIRYCERDTQNCRTIFDRLRPLFPATEIRLIDLVLRMFIDPQVCLDPDVLAQHLGAVQAEKAAVMARVAHIDKSVFSSNPQFAKLLTDLGVEVPMKVSPVTGLLMPALAKNDRGFKELCSDPDQPMEVQALLAARLHAKSTLEETRTAKLLDLSMRTWPGKGQGWGPVPLKYWGAHTGRLSGDGGENWQNFKRGSQMRQAIKAPPGWRIVHRDASQIEARMVAWMARCTKLLDAFANGRDVYSEFATEVYGRPVTKKDKGDRFVGKTSILGLGYGMGWERFKHTLYIGNGGMSLDVPDQESKRIVYFYRRLYEEIPLLWGQAGRMMTYMAMLNAPLTAPLRRLRDTYDGAYNNIPTVRGVKPGREAIWLPNGMCIQYPGLRIDRTRNSTGSIATEMTYRDPYGSPVHMFGGKTVENISQGLARIVVTDSAVRVYDKTGYHPFLTTHDSLDYCVPESDVRWFDEELEQQFAVRPSWGPDLPLASEGGWGQTLLQAEQAQNN